MSYVRDQPIKICNITPEEIAICLFSIGFGNPYGYAIGSLSGKAYIETSTNEKMISFRGTAMNPGILQNGPLLLQAG